VTPGDRDSSASRRDEPRSSWSARIATVFGIPIRVHATFLLIVVFYAFLARSSGQSVPAAVGLVLAVFLCVVLHELGHALMARQFGVRTREIVLYPIGGIARLENIPSGWAEILIALAGPAVNLVLAGMLLPFAAHAIAAGLPAQPGRGPLVVELLVANLFLLLFNLIPALPMDGGRVLRASLSLVMPEDRATRIAAGIAQFVALGFGAIGLFAGYPMLLFIALFVFLGASQEAAFSERKSFVAGRTVGEAMVTKFEVLAPQDSLAWAAQLLLETHQQDFPVVDAWGRVAGVLPRATLIEGLARTGKDAAVLDVMLREPLTAAPGDDLEQALVGLQARPSQPMLVLDDERLVGMVTLDNLAEFIEVSRSTRPRGA
jgi:stage IV sporulation protein FB